MNRAHQHALFQATNQGLLGIRQSELTYYINLNIAFGTQAALIGGFTYGVFTQNQFNDGAAYSDVIQDIYWVFSSCTIAAAVHVILTTMLMQVLGPGLALHGPVGSMARATEGMRIEQKVIIKAFIVMMISFSLSTVLCFWTVFSLEAAASATFVWLIAFRYYYFYCERIYLRFYWKEESDYLRREDVYGDVGAEDSFAPPVYDDMPENENPIHGVRSMEAGREPGTLSKPLIGSAASNDGEAGRGDKKKKKGRVISKFIKNLPFGRSKRPASSVNEQNPSTDYTAPHSAFNVANLIGGRAPHAASTKTVIMEGFLMQKIGLVWERRYFSMNGQGYLYQYKSRQDYRNNPRAPINKRPIVLSDHFVEVLNSELEEDGEKRSVQSATAPGTSRVLFQLTFIPREAEEVDMTNGGSEGEDDHDAAHGRRQERVLRCDTAEELSIWVDCMQEICPSSFRS